MRKYRVTEDFKSELFTNPKTGDILIQNGDYLYDDNGNLVCQIGSREQKNKTEFIGDFHGDMVCVDETYWILNS